MCTIGGGAPWQAAELAIVAAHRDLHNQLVRQPEPQTLVLVRRADGELYVERPAGVV